MDNNGDIGETSQLSFNQTAQNPAIPPPLCFKTPAELRCRRDKPATSSPMNINAPPFIPVAPNPFASETRSTAASTYIASWQPGFDMADLKAEMDEMQSELRLVKAELKTTAICQ